MIDPSASSHIKAHDLTFKPFISPDTIAERVHQLGQEIADRHPDTTPVFLTILTGAVFFAADLIRACPLRSEMSFVRLASYEGTRSTGSLTEVLGIKEDLEGRLVIVLEDIIDTGNTLAQFLPRLKEEKPAEIEVASLLLKPEALQHKLQIDYVGFEIPNHFVIGYGLDYKSLGRDLPGIYQLVE